MNNHARSVQNRHCLKTKCKLTSNYRLPVRKDVNHLSVEKHVYTTYRYILTTPSSWAYVDTLRVMRYRRRRRKDNNFYITFERAIIKTAA